MKFHLQILPSNPKLESFEEVLKRPKQKNSMLKLTPLAPGGTFKFNTVGKENYFLMSWMGKQKI